jgi:hypothetical protein
MRRGIMFGPIFTGILLSLILIVVSLKKANAARIGLGIFFLLMAIGVNGTITFLNPQLYVTYGQEALLSSYRDLCSDIIVLNPVVFGLLLILFEISIGLLMLYKGIYVKVGLAGAILFLIAISPVSLIQIPWLGLIIPTTYLLTKNFETTFWDALRAKFRERKT